MTFKDDDERAIRAIRLLADVVKRYESYGCHVVMVEDGNIDLATIEAAIQQCKEETTRPSIIKLRTTIGYGSLEEGTHGVHGNPLKADDIKQLKSKWGFNANEAFHVPEEVYQAYQNRAAEGLAAKQAWESLLAKCADQFPELHADLQRRPTSTLPQGWEASPPSFSPSDPAVATQKLSETILSKIHAIVPELIGGSSDLRPSNLTRWASAVDFQAPGLEDIPGDYLGRYLRYGVREYALGAIMNGLAAYGTVLPYGGTFLNFVSYAAGAVRLSALSRIRVIWVATHDSIALGQDEPTHQPIETLVHFRTMPNCSVWRPADGNETSATYLVSLKSMSTPSILALSRQNLPQLRGSSVEKASRGGYVSEDYKRSVLGSGVPSLSVKALSTVGWQRWTHQQFGIDTFGASAPADVLFAKFEFSKEGVAKHAISTIEFFKKKSQSIGSPLGRAF
ncbi:hypothetical protein LRP88_10563 [Fusarium phalaenopsidis]